MPELTVGGRSAAAMAVPTTDEMLAFDSASATPVPDSAATIAPNRSWIAWPRDRISLVGQ
jgi:hypothetical protein